METIDPAKAARVWQRVQGTAEPEKKEQGLQALILEKWTAAATYLLLSRRFDLRESAILKKMFQEEQTQTNCLKGIYTLITGNHPTVKAIPPQQESVENTLRRCYGREMRCLAEYEARSSDPEFGQVFSRLAQQEQEHCRLLLELLGSSKKGK